MYKKILQHISGGNKMFSLLVDPDNPDMKQLALLAGAAQQSKVDFFFVGGSLLTTDRMEHAITVLRANSNIPIIIFPGTTMQIHKSADAILFLSLISGRNPELLIGRQVIAAPYIREAKLEAIPTGYMLIESGKSTSALYMSNSMPIPADKNDIACSTALAGEMLGLKMIYLEAGSGARDTVPAGMVSAVRKQISIPLIVGGGIRSAATAIELCRAGADMIVTGNATAGNHSLIRDISEAVHSLK